jgi:hypothetical protein
MYGRVEVCLHAFITLALDGGRLKCIMKRQSIRAQRRATLRLSSSGLWHRVNYHRFWGTNCLHLQGRRSFAVFPSGKCWLRTLHFPRPSESIIHPVIQRKETCNYTNQFSSRWKFAIPSPTISVLTNKIPAILSGPLNQNTYRAIYWLVRQILPQLLKVAEDAAICWQSPQVFVTLARANNPQGHRPVRLGEMTGFCVATRLFKAI